MICLIYIPWYFIDTPDFDISLIYLKIWKGKIEITGKKIKKSYFKYFAIFSKPKNCNYIFKYYKYFSYPLQISQIKKKKTIKIWIGLCFKLEIETLGQRSTTSFWLENVHDWSCLASILCLNKKTVDVSLCFLEKWFYSLNQWFN